MAVTVSAITDQVMGSDKSPSHCTPVSLLGLSVINEGTFLPRVVTNAPAFTEQLSVQGRMGVFAVTAGKVTRAWIVLLPASGVPDRVMIGISPSIGQAADYYAGLNGSNPLSPALILDFVALINGMNPITGQKRHGRNQACYGSQILGSSRPMALLWPVRALRDGGGVDGELGPFVSDGAVITETIHALAGATGGAFKPSYLECFAHSNESLPCYAFLKSVADILRSATPSPSIPAHAHHWPGGIADSVSQHLSGQTGGIVNGRAVGNFEYWPLSRWKNEPGGEHALRGFHNDLFAYLHVWACPRYLLRFSIQMSMA